MNFDHHQPIYRQIMADIKRKLAVGAMAAGSRVASVRDLALAYGVNPNTMQKALSELEREGLLHSERTAGRLVTEDERAIERLRLEEQTGATRRYVAEMTSLGFPRERIPSIVDAYLKEENEIANG
jgi:DNA-binding transcriptional regulator YhcF (GntR family)